MKGALRVGNKNYHVLYQKNVAILLVGGGFPLVFVLEASAILAALNVALLFVRGTIDGAEAVLVRGFGLSGVRDSEPYTTGVGRT